MKINKVAVIGAGAVGTSIAFDIILQGICDELLMIDINKAKAESEVLDLKHCTGYSNSSIKIKSGEYSECSDADIVVITAAAPLIKGQTRLDMLSTAKKITKSIVNPIMQSGFNGHFVIVTNPVDIISYYVYKLSGLPKNKIIGTGTALDSARLKVLLADLIGVEARSVQAYTIGEHGDSQFIPWSTVSIGGKQFYDILIDNKERLNGFNSDKVLEEIKKSGWKIADIKGTTNYGIAATTVDIIKSILNDESKVIPVSAFLEGEYGINDVFIGVPTIINRSGISEIVELRLDEEEQSLFNNSVSILKKYINQL
ncbi:MAG: L-lactate dehydrogenase [Clostridium butyricum]|nr:L-lactate dehydrogenase [Clostridium butyricum]